MQALTLACLGFGVIAIAFTLDFRLKAFLQVAAFYWPFVLSWSCVAIEYRAHRHRRSRRERELYRQWRE